MMRLPATIATAIDAALGRMLARASLRERQRPFAIVYDIECRDRAGALRWRERAHNVVCTAGSNDLLDKYLKGSSYTAAWYMLLAGSGTKAVGDTLASHAGWTEVTAYTGNRQAVTWGTTSGGSNTASAVSFSMTGAYTVAGAGICTVASGTSGILYSVSDIAAARTGASGDTLNITPTIAQT